MKRTDAQAATLPFIFTSGIITTERKSEQNLLTIVVEELKVPPPPL